MNFSEALEAMKRGEKVRRSDWTIGWLRCIDGEVKAEDWSSVGHLLTELILAEDWEIVPEPPKEGTYEWAEAQLELGKRVTNGFFDERVYYFKDKGDFWIHTATGEVDLTDGPCCSSRTDWRIWTPEPKPRGFGWALKQMRKGRKVRRRAWPLEACWTLSNGELMGESGWFAASSVENLLATDWELAE